MLLRFRPSRSSEDFPRRVHLRARIGEADISVVFSRVNRPSRRFFWISSTSRNRSAISAGDAAYRHMPKSNLSGDNTTCEGLVFRPTPSRAASAFGSESCRWCDGRLEPLNVAVKAPQLGSRRWQEPTKRGGLCRANRLLSTPSADFSPPTG